MKLHDATIKYPPKEWDGKYGPYLQCKVTLSTGEDVGIFENDITNGAFLALRKGQKIQVIEDIGKNGKPKYKPVLEQEDTPTESTTRSPMTPSPVLSPSERLDQLLDCFAEVLVRVEKRFPDREPDWQRAAATTLLIQMQKEYGQALGIAAQSLTTELVSINYNDIPQPASPVVREADPNKPWKNWKSPNDAIVWAQGELPSWDIDDLKIAFDDLPGENGKKAKAWCEWVRKRKEVFGSAGDETWF